MLGSNGPWVLIRPFMPRGMRTMHFETLERAKQPHDIARRSGRARDGHIATIRGPKSSDWPHGFCIECGPNIGDEWIPIYGDRRKQPEDAESEVKV